MAAATVRPKNEATSNRRHIPAEIVEEILLHLPVKSVVRFSSVSKSWRSMISQQRFIKRYGAVSGREERIVISPSCGDVSMRYSSCTLLSISSNQTIQDETKIVSPFVQTPHLVASCDELWCVKVGASLFLWNPSMNTYKRLASSPLTTGRMADYEYYGLGYDCVGDDYKILKFSIHNTSLQNTELYSLRNDSWRNIKFFPDGHNYGIYYQAGVFVSGALHWVDYTRDTIVTFDLTTEMYGEVASPTTSRDDSSIAVIVLKRKLCTYLSHYLFTNFVLWMTEDHGANKTWTKLFEVQSTTGTFQFPFTSYFFYTFRPLYLYDNGDILIEIMSFDYNWNLFIYKDGNAIPKKIVGRGRYTKVSRSYVYVESLVSPAMRPKDIGCTLAGL